LKAASEGVKQLKETINSWSAYNPERKLYLCSKAISWDYSQNLPCKGDAKKESKTNVSAPILQQRTGERRSE
jgi:hypothetical protein